MPQKVAGNIVIRPQAGSDEFTQKMQKAADATRSFGGVVRTMGSDAQRGTQAGSPPITKTPIAFGAFDQYVTRRRAMTVIRLPERFSDFFEVGFVAWWRVDGQLLQPSAVKTMNTVF